MMKKILLSVLFAGVVSIFPQLFLKAQAADPPCDPMDPNCDPGGDPDAIPLDPGSWVLVAAGVGYGVKKWRDSRQNNSKNIHRLTEVTRENEVKESF